MIRILEYTNVLNIDVKEFSCPECFKPLQWGESQLSPANCSGCQSKMMDITKIIGNIEWRAAYHYMGDNFVRCGFLNPKKNVITADTSGLL
jgi:hypothetical protein